MMPLSRRQILTGASLGFAGILAGCGGVEGDTRDPQSPDIPTDSPITETGFEGNDLVVSLRDEHSVSRVNLIDPEGSLYRGTTVAVGETTARIKILDIRPGVGGYEHYEPGRYELVAVEGEESNSVTVELEPDIRVVDVQQYRDGEYASDLGKLAVKVENIGTGPTWVYDITFYGAPNFAADDPLVEFPGLPRLHGYKTDSDILLGPNERITHVSVPEPLLFSDTNDGECGGNASFELILGVATTDTLNIEIFAEIGGTPTSLQYTSLFGCDNISIEKIEVDD
jgi:hypothetical protein